MKFGKAAVLVEQIQILIAEHGDDLEIAFCVDRDTLDEANDSVIGSIKLDGVEKSKTPRLDLTFETT